MFKLAIIMLLKYINNNSFLTRRLDIFVFINLWTRLFNITWNYFVKSCLPSLKNNFYLKFDFGFSVEKDTDNIRSLSANTNLFVQALSTENVYISWQCTYIVVLRLQWHVCNKLLKLNIKWQKDCKLNFLLVSSVVHIQPVYVELCSTYDTWYQEQRFICKPLYKTINSLIAV